MLNFIDSFYEDVFGYVNSHFSKDLLKAKQEFFGQVNLIPDDKSELYEGMMNFFNEWFLFQYRNSRDMKGDYLSRILKNDLKTRLDNEQLKSIKEHSFSLFEFLKIKRKGPHFYDWRAKEKFYLAGEYKSLGFLEGDFFIARKFSYKNQNYFLKGQSVLPKECKGEIKKQLKLIAKGKMDLSFEEYFLFLEGKKSKFQLYPHCNPVEIFQMT